MSFLRTMSTPRLLVLLAVVVLSAVGGTAIALAATGGGPAPPAKPLDAAVHDALAGPETSGMSARVTFTNHLLGSAGIEGSTPLLNGASGRLWLTKHHLRLELQSDQGDSQLLVDQHSFWLYDVGSNTVYRGRLPRDAKVERPATEQHRAPSLMDVRDAIARISRHASLSGAVPTNIGGQPAYDVRIVPKDGGLVGAVRLAWDARHGVPLRLAVYAKGSSSPSVELKATEVRFGSVPASTFAVAPPKDATVTDLSPSDLHPAHGSKTGKHGEVSGRTAVARSLPFTLAAPSTLAGQRLSEVRLVGEGGDRAALARYGRGLGGIAVIERKADSSKTAPDRHGEHGGRALSLPRVDVGGTATEELATPLGTMIRFDRGGVSYLVVGSVTKATAEAAVRGLLR